MTNEEAQKREDMLLDLYKIKAYLPNDAEGNPLTPFGNFCAGYEAAIAYMQEQNKSAEQSEPVAWKYFDEAYKKATESSEPDDWMNAALLAQQVRRNQLNTKG